MHMISSFTASHISDHYKSFDSHCRPITDYHTRKRDHSKLAPGTLDADGILAHTDFDIDPKRCDPNNDDHWNEFVDRRRIFEEQLKILYDNTPKRAIPKLPPNITYVRPFLSSTFKDFDAERTLCFAQSFPRLEQLCNERNLFFAPLDLRWGVTSEQSGSGQVIKICLEEIERSRPYFVCSLGYRNGWSLMADDDPRDQYVQLLHRTFDIAAASYPWVGLCRDRSVTEIEILHGALNAPELTHRSLFYFRDVRFLESLPKSARAMHVEIGEREKRLQQLKTRIVARGFRLSYFATPSQMCDALETDLRTSIEADFPILVLSALEREVRDQQAFAEMRTRVHVGADANLAVLDHFLRDSSEDAPQVLVIAGPSGSGKSSLIANWMKRLRATARRNGFSGNKQTLTRSTTTAGDMGLRTFTNAKDGTSSTVSGTGTARALHSTRRSSPEPTLNALSSTKVAHTASLPPVFPSALMSTSTPIAGSASAGASGSGAQGQTVLHWNCALFQDRYIGSTSDSTQPATLIRWLIAELSARYDPASSSSSSSSTSSSTPNASTASPDAQSDNRPILPTDPKRIVEEWPDFLAMATPSAPVLLVLDGLDQLYNEDDAHHLSWLPLVWPRCVKVVVSTIGGSLTHRTLVAREQSRERALAGELIQPPTPCSPSSPTPSSRAAAAFLSTGRVSPTLSSAPTPATSLIPRTQFLPLDQLSDFDCIELVRTFLGSYGKSLDGGQESRILACERTRNPLYLCTFLHEVRVFGSFDNLTRRIEHYMAANSISEMFLKVIGRLEEDFESTAPNLVRMTLSLMMVARRGLNERELRGALELGLGITHSHGAPTAAFPAMEFSALMMRLNDQLVDQRGLRKFSHNYLKFAVETKYFTVTNTAVAAPANAARKSIAISTAPASSASSGLGPILVSSAAASLAAAASAARTVAVSSNSTRRVLGEYFASMPGVSARKVEEAPWALWTILNDMEERSREQEEDAADAEDDEDEEDDDEILAREMRSRSGSSPAPVPRARSPPPIQRTMTAKQQMTSISSALIKQITDLDLFDLLCGEYKYDLHKYWLCLERLRSADVARKRALHAAALASASPNANQALSEKDQAQLLSYTAACYSLALKRWSTRPMRMATSIDGRPLHPAPALPAGASALLPTPLMFAMKAESIGTFLIGTDRYVGADLFLDQALDIRRKLSTSASTPRPGVPGVAQAKSKYDPQIELIISKKANLFYRQGRYDEALPLYQQSLALVEENSAMESAKSAASTTGSGVPGAMMHASVRSSVLRTSIAGLLKEAGRFAESQPLYEQSLRDKIGLLGPRHAIVAISMSNLAELHLRLAEPDRALPLYQAALGIMESERGRSHPEVATIVSSLASCYMQLDNYTEAILLYDRARKIKEDAFGTNHVSVAVVLNNLAAAIQKRAGGEADSIKAVALLERSMAIRQSVHGSTSPLVIPTLINLGEVYLDLKKYSRASAYFHRARLIIESSKGHFSVELMPVLASEAKLACEQSQFDRALVVYRKQLTIMERNYGREDERIMQCLNNIGMAYQSRAEFANALPYHLRELHLVILIHGAADKRVADVLCILGVLLVSLDKSPSALLAFQRCFVLRRIALGATHESTVQAKGWVDDLNDDDELDDDALLELELDDIEWPVEINAIASQSAWDAAGAESARDVAMEAEIAAAKALAHAHARPPQAARTTTGVRSGGRSDLAAKMRNAITPESDGGDDDDNANGKHRKNGASLAVLTMSDDVASISFDQSRSPMTMRSSVGVTALTPINDALPSGLSPITSSTTRPSATEGK